ncbi:TonB family protein [Asticcacaulis sp. YBE204]|uniref:TonB family protein n=1 Tax=Asticcacaulis sp. YBE204 TaxID=1282363 RepID=UPI0003C3D4DB|nr:TonB family protein [Asticcacaulis sp. YBE204]ESQ78034.1 hypothetical protein AEYBE204_16185 [Asticcacaulis sp. YBE204]
MLVFRITTSVMACLALVSVAQAQDAALPPVPSFKTLPVGQAMASLYPKAAAKARIEGDVVIACGWTAKGHLRNCRVIKETPEGYGFAEATVKGFETYAELKDVAGESALGEEKKVRYKWTIR